MRILNIALDFHQSPHLVHESLTKRKTNFKEWRGVSLKIGTNTVCRCSCREIYHFYWWTTVSLATHWLAAFRHFPGKSEFSEFGSHSSPAPQDSFIFHTPPHSSSRPLAHTSQHRQTSLVSPLVQLVGGGAQVRCSQAMHFKASVLSMTIPMKPSTANEMRIFPFNAIFDVSSAVFECELDPKFGGTDFYERTSIV